jgi:hypothetical protein
VSGCLLNLPQLSVFSSTSVNGSARRSCSVRVAFRRFSTYLNGVAMYGFECLIFNYNTF